MFIVNGIVYYVQ